MIKSFVAISRDEMAAKYSLAEVVCSGFDKPVPNLVKDLIKICCVMPLAQLLLLTAPNFVNSLAAFDRNSFLNI